jgi:hypothetical protein
VSEHTVDSTPLRDAFERSGLSASELCVRLNWRQRCGKPDTSRLKRALGLMPMWSGGRAACSARIGLDRAALIADALNLDPREVGL